MDEFEGDYLLTDNQWDELVWVWQQTDVPKGCRVEIIEGLITVTPLSASAHHGITEHVQRRLYEVIPDDWGSYWQLGVAVPSRLGLYVPDLVVMPQDVLRSRSGFVPADKAELVVEIASKTTATNDRTHKAAGYAHVGIPLYLLIDGLAPGGPTITLFGEPEGGVYRILRASRFGDPFTLPRPFELALDTCEFPVD